MPRLSKWPHQRVAHRLKILVASTIALLLYSKKGSYSSKINTEGIWTCLPPSIIAPKTIFSLLAWGFLWKANHTPAQNSTETHHCTQRRTKLLSMDSKTCHGWSPPLLPPLCCVSSYIQVSLLFLQCVQCVPTIRPLYELCHLPEHTLDSQSPASFPLLILLNVLESSLATLPKLSQDLPLTLLCLSLELSLPMDILSYYDCPLH